MQNSALITSVVRQQKAAELQSWLTQWVALEQADIPESAEEATLKDAFAMVDYARAGRSARDYIQDRCPYVVAADGVLTVTLDFYAWPSSMDIYYELTTSIGEIGRGQRFYRKRSFDVVFNNTDSVNVGFLFDGSLTAQMPFFDSEGRVLSPSPSITVDGTHIVLSQKATVVLRANVIASGYEHKITMTLSAEPVTKTDEETGNIAILSGYAIDNLEATITVIWGECGPDDLDCIESNMDILTMEVPGCIKDLLEACDEVLLPALDSSNSGSGSDSSQKDATYVVYFSSCSGEILEKFWRDAE